MSDQKNIPTGFDDQIKEIADLIDAYSFTTWKIRQLNSFTVEDLRRELYRRKKAKIFLENPPKPLAQPDLSSLIGYATDVIGKIQTGEITLNTLEEHPVRWDVMAIVYGPGVFTWVRQVFHLDPPDDMSEEELD